MRTLVTYSAVACLALAQASTVYAADGTKADMPASGSMSSAMPAKTGAPVANKKMDAALADGVVKKVDRQAAMVTLEHGEIKDIGMPAMTMAYKARDAAVLRHAKEGEKVRFRLENVGGAYLITTLEKR